MDNQLYCKNCGTQIENGADFCIECGVPIPRNKTLIATPAALLTIAIGVVALVLLRPILPFPRNQHATAPAESTKPETIEHAEIEPFETEREDTEETATTLQEDTSPNSSTANESVHESMQDTKTLSGVSLSNPDDQAALNMFVSNFTEAGFYQDGGTFTRTSYDVNEVARFAFNHSALNGGSTEWRSNEADNLPKDTKDTMLNVRLGKYHLDYNTDRFLGISCDWSRVSSYVWYKDALYSEFTGGGIGSCGPAVVTSVEDIDSSHIRVKFVGYYQDGLSISYDPSDKSTYALTIDELSERLHADGPTRNGVAEIEVLHTGDQRFKLVSMTVY